MTESTAPPPAWIMDARKQPAPNNEPPQRTRVWQPESRIAGYIKGSVKLEEMVSREKLIRPEQRHNRRVFKALINDDDEPASATFVKSKNRSVISRCPSSSTKTSTSLSRVGSVLPHQQLTTDDLTRTIVEKNEHITALRDQLEALRSCARLEQLPKGGNEHSSLRAVLERLLECLLDMLTNLRHNDEHDERMAQFVVAVERERENVLRSVDALCQANTRKDDELRQMSGEHEQVRSHLQKLLQDKGGPSSEERRLCAHNIDLLQRLRTYEEKYQKATEELRNLSRLAESVHKHIDAEKEAFNKRSKEHRKNIEDLHSSYRCLEEKKEEAEKRLMQIVKTHADEVAQLREQKEESVASVQQLKNEVQRVKSVEQRLQVENAALVAQLEEERQQNERIRDEIKRIIEEKEALETDLADRGTSDADDPVQRTVENVKMTSFAEQESQWHQLKRCFYKTVKRAGILPDDDVR